MLLSRERKSGQAEKKDGIGKTLHQFIIHARWRFTAAPLSLNAIPATAAVPEVVVHLAEQQVDCESASVNPTSPETGKMAFVLNGEPAAEPAPFGVIS